MEVKEKSADLGEQSSKEQVKPSSLKKKKNYRVIESRYMKTSKPPTPPVARLESKGRGTPRYKTPSKTNKVIQENSKLEETLASKSICVSGIRISTPHRDIGLNDTPYLNCSEISSINTTLKDTGNQSIERPLKNPSIRRPLLDNNALNKKLKAVTQKGNVISSKQANFPIIEEEKNQKLPFDINNPMDLEIIYSQYLIGNYLAVHAEKHLEIQDKDTSRLLVSLVESNKILTEKVAQLEMECNKVQIENDMEKFIENQNAGLCLMTDSIGYYVNRSEDITNSFKDFHNQLLLKSVHIPDHSALEINLSNISAQLTNNLEEKLAIDTLFEPLNQVTRDVLKDNVGETGNVEKIGHNCQNISSLGSYQVSLALQQNKPCKNNSIQEQINTLLYNW